MKPSELLEQRAKQNGIVYPKMSAAALLEKNNGNYLDEVAIKYYGNDITYGRLFEMINKYNCAFASYGVEKGDTVSVCLPSIPESIAIFYALTKIGAQFHTILPTATTEQIVDTLQKNHSRIFLTLDSFYPRVGEALKIVDVPLKVKLSANHSLPFGMKQLKQFRDILTGETYKEIPTDFIKLKQFLSHGKNSEILSNPCDEFTVAAVTNSSGSTAQNKGIQLTSYGFNAMAINYKNSTLKIHRGQTFHSIIPPLYATGLSNSVNLPLQLGFPTILEPMFNKDTYPGRFMRVQPNLSIVPVPHAKALLDYLREEYQASRPKDRQMLSFVDVFSVGGSHLPIPWEEELEFYLEYFGSKASIGKGYGLSEHNSALTASTKRMIGASGIVLPGVILGIFDPVTNEELGFGKEGQIRAISPCDMAGYFHNEELTNTYFQTGKDGKRWGHTGDIGKLELIDGEVWLFYSGREKENIKINGTNILLAKIQNKVFECDLIDDCEVVVMDLDDKKIPVAHIVLKNKMISEEEALKELHIQFQSQSEIEPYAYQIHDTLPVLISGKVDKPKLSNVKDGYIKYEEGKISDVDFCQKVLKKSI